MTDWWVGLQVSLLQKILIWHNPQFCTLEQSQTSERCQLLISETVIITWSCIQSSTHYFQAELSSGTTHSPFHWTTLILQRGVNCWLLRQLLLTNQILAHILPPVFKPDYHQEQPTVLSVELCLYFREVSIDDCWDSSYWPTKSSPDLPPPVFKNNYHQAQPTVMYVGIGSDFREVSIDDCWDSYYQPIKSSSNLPPPFLA